MTHLFNYSSMIQSETLIATYFISHIMTFLRMKGNALENDIRTTQGEQSLSWENTNV